MKKHDNKQEIIDELQRLLLKVKGEGDTVEVVAKTIAQLQALNKENGLYMPLPSICLLPKSETLFNNNIYRIREELIKSSVSAETIEAVTKDYGKVTAGDFLYIATPPQMLEVLKKVKPYHAYLIDKYGFYFGVMQQYSRCLAMVGKFNDAFRGKNATIETKTAFVQSDFNANDSVALNYLLDRRYFTLSEFDGIEREHIIAWLDDLDFWGQIGRYLFYYTISKFALGATIEELKTIVPPPCFADVDDAQDEAENYCVKVQDMLDKVYNIMLDLIEANNKQEQEQAKKAVEDWKSKANKAPVSIGHNSAIILSRDMYGSFDAKARDILPISAYIEDYMKTHGLDKKISPYVVEKAVMGINLLQRIRKEKPQNGRYMFYTNISEFANACYDRDANEDEKIELMHALRILNDLYIVVWKPTGRVAIKLLTLWKVGLTGAEKGKLTIEVTTQATNTNERPISAADFKKLQQEGKGQAQIHFAGQVLSKGNKGHKCEDDLLNEIFGYNRRLDEARMHHATDEDIRLIMRQIGKNKTNNRKQLKRMFDKAQADGLIKYTTRTGKNGGTVYDWVSLMHAKPTGNNTQEPDEQ